jgi:hypothetical protein
VVNSKQVPDSKTPILFSHAYVWKGEVELSSWTPAHQKFLMIEVILKMKVLENKMVDI